MTDKERFLEFVNWKTGEIATRVNVTGHSERRIERCLRGMLINVGDDWIVRDTADEPEPKAPNDLGRYHPMDF